jgi:hypothetical protein
VSRHGPPAGRATLRDEALEFLANDHIKLSVGVPPLLFAEARLDEEATAPRRADRGVMNCRVDRPIDKEHARFLTRVKPEAWRRESDARSPPAALQAGPYPD